MRTYTRLSLCLLFLALIPTACVDSYDPQLPGNIDVVIVDGTINNLPEQQVIRLNRSKSDPINGRPGFMPLTKAMVLVIVDSSQVVEAHETVDGVYYLPADFRGKIGHAYQLRFTLSDGSTYQSTQQIMPDVPTIGKIRVEFNLNSLSPTLLDGYTAAHDFYIDTQDPEGQPNYYKWDWKVWENQEWCRSCEKGLYSIDTVEVKYSANGFMYFETGNQLFEKCFYPPPSVNTGNIRPYWIYDYKCRTKCWAIFSGAELNLFADSYTDGRLISNRRVAQIPFYQHGGSLVELRQSSLTPSAYRFYKDMEEQTQNIGSIVDPPPTASVGNVQNVANRREIVVGYFTAAGVATVRYWFDRKDTRGEPPGLFLMVGREPTPEPPPHEGTIVQILDKNSLRARPYTAVCVDSENQTSYMPQGWRE